MGSQGKLKRAPSTEIFTSRSQHLQLIPTSVITCFSERRCQELFVFGNSQQAKAMVIEKVLLGISRELRSFHLCGLSFSPYDSERPGDDISVSQGY